MSGWGVASYGWAQKAVQESTPGEEITKTVKITTFRGLRILHKLSWQRSRVWEDPLNSERCSTVGKMLSMLWRNCSGGKSWSIKQMLLFYFQKKPRPLISTTLGWSASNLQHGGNLPPAKRLQLTEGSEWWLAFLKYGHFFQTQCCLTNHKVYIKTLTFICTRETEISCDLLYCSGLEPSPQHLWNICLYGHDSN